MAERVLVEVGEDLGGERVGQLDDLLRADGAVVDAKTTLRPQPQARAPSATLDRASRRCWRPDRRPSGPGARRSSGRRAPRRRRRPSRPAASGRLAAPASSRRSGPTGSPTACPDAVRRDEGHLVAGRPEARAPRRRTRRTSRRPMPSDPSATTWTDGAIASATANARYAAIRLTGPAPGTRPASTRSRRRRPRHRRPRRGMRPARRRRCGPAAGRRRSRPSTAARRSRAMVAGVAPSAAASRRASPSRSVVRNADAPPVGRPVRGRTADGPRPSNTTRGGSRRSTAAVDPPIVKTWTSVVVSLCRWRPPASRPVTRPGRRSGSRPPRATAARRRGHPSSPGRRPARRRPPARPPR